MTEDRIVIDLDEEFTIDSGSFMSMGKASPFDGWKVRGRVLQNMHKGKIVYNNLTK
jgi:dihydroorotase